MAIAITEDHQALAGTASHFLGSHDARRASRGLLESESEPMPEMWAELAGLGWLGIHLPEEHGGSGYGLAELVVLVEELAKAVAPGPFVPCVITSAVLAATGDEETRRRYLPGLAAGSLTGAVALEASVTASGGTVSGEAAPVLGGGLAQLLLVPVGDDVAAVEVGEGVEVSVPPNLDPTRRCAKVSLREAPATLLRGARRTMLDLARVILAADAVGVARAATDMAAAYARERRQFGRVIGTFQAVKHHCANMAVATELATSAVWDAARAASKGGEQLSYAAAVAATLAADAADLCANLNTQVHGGIGMTWEHDAHLLMRRATTLLCLLEPGRAASEVTDLARRGVVRIRDVDLPPEAEPIRAEVRAFVDEVKQLPGEGRLERMIETGYVMPHWPKPYGRAAGAVEQLVIEEELAKAGIARPQYGITAWNILTIIQYGTADQLARWVLPALRQEVVWCQLFSEPDAGSDAAGIATRGTRVEGGWLVNGEKVWTSGAQLAGMGFATVRTDPTKPKHEGITMMAIDMHADGVEVRPLRQASGHAAFNEVFLNDVLVPDDDVVGPVDGGWTVARTTLGNESVSIGGGGGGMGQGAAMIAALDAAPQRLVGGSARIGRYLAGNQALGLVNLRQTHRAVAGSEPGPEGAITKLVSSELGAEAAAILTELAGPEAAFFEGLGELSNSLVLMHRGLSIAGGTSEIKRNQIGERILGLPRDPLVG
ncbi:MAG TPA: acyl-CoA dehydrogenase [Acidimicrobiales bacterium]|nr:acyl-CoA dehydrogenase [Acidimicrobiales bacterium]